MPTTIANQITLDGTFTDWPASDMIMTAANTVAGYQVYGAFLNDATLGNAYVIGIDATNSADAVIGPGTTIYLNTDHNDTTGYSPFGTVGAEYEVQFALDSNNVLQPYLYSVTPTGVTTKLNGGVPLDNGISSNGESVELAIPQSLVTPTGGPAPTSISFDVLINNTQGLPASFTLGTEYNIIDSAAAPPPTTIANLITLDGQFSDWPATDMIMTPRNTVAGYQVYGAFLNDATLGNTYVIGIDATNSADAVIGPGTTIYLNTDQNTATGYSPFGSVGAEYEVRFALGSNNELQPYLYSVTSAGATTLLNNGQPLDYGFSSNGESVELAVPQSLVTPIGGSAPTSINFDVLINNTQGLPSDFTSGPQYTITDPATLVPVDHTVKKVGIVFSSTTAALYFGGGQAGETAYSDLFMSAQHQAEAAGVSYDILTDADLTNVAKLSQYSALIFPDFQNVQSSQASAIANALNQVVYDYHVPIITAGAFMTNDQNGNPLPGDSYANMQALLNLTQTGFGTATYSVTPDPTALANNNPILSGYTAGQLIGGASGEFAGTTHGYYTNTGYLTFGGYTQPATTLADINIQGGATVPGVVQTTTGGTNTDFATTSLMGDSNLLQHVIQNTVFGTTPSLTMDITRFKGVLNSRNDTEDAQFPEDVDPSANGFPGVPGIYDELIPMLQQWKQQYDFVGSYYINVGDNANPANGNLTNWAVSDPYYKSILAMGNEIGSHSYTHLINPPTVDSNGNPVPTTWAENTNTLYVTPPANGSAPNWTFSYEFGTGNSIIDQNLGITVAGAAVPGAPDTVATSANIEQYYQTASLPAGLTGYVNGGWTGAGSGAPNAFGYIDPSNTGSVYIAPNITFDFTELQFYNKTPAQALTDWESLFNQLSANSETPVIVWPWHDYGPTNYSQTTPGAPGPGYTEAMYMNFIAYAYNAGYEFVTGEELAQRIAAEQAAKLTETTSGSGNVITATVTPDPTKPDLGAMALNVVNGAAGQVIQNAGNWYAYDSKSVFMPYGGGTFNVTLGATQDDVTHIDSLPMRADLKSVTGDGTNLSFSMTGDGTVDIHIKTPGANVISVSAPLVSSSATVTATLNGDDLQLVFNDGPLAISSTSPQGVSFLHNVTITEGATAVAGATFVFGDPPPQPTITSATYTGSASTGHWSLSGSAVAGSTVTTYDGATKLGTTTATGGSWTFATAENDSVIRDYTVIATVSGATSVASAPYYEGTPNNDVFDFASEAALSAAALINGDGGASDTLQLTSATTLSDADFAHVKAVNILGLTGASGITLGANASAAGIKTVVTGNGATSITDSNSGTLTVNATALGAGNTLTLAGTTTMTVTGLTGNLSTAGDTGPLTVTATGTTAQNVATGSGATSIADSATGGSVVVDATALGTGTLTLSGSAAETVNNLAGNVVVSGAGAVTVNATGSGAQSVTTGTGATTITDNGSGSMTVNANASGAAQTLKLSGSANETVTNLGENIVATGLTGALSVTTKTNALSIATGTGGTTINAGAMTGALTLTGANAATVTALGGNLNAIGDSGALTVTTTGATQTVTTGSSNISITDDSTGVLTVNGAALAGSTLTLTGTGAVTVNNLKGNLNATGDSGALTVSATGTTAQTVATGSGAMSIADSAAGVTVNAAALLGTNTLTLSGSAAKTVNNLAGNVVATGAGAITVTATGTGPQTIQTGSGKDTIIAATGGDTIQGGGGGDSINVSGHTVADTFIYAATSDSPNTIAGHDTISGFAASGSIYDLLDFSKVNAGLSIEGQVSSGSTVAADSIAWLYSMGNAMCYVNDTASPLATGNTSLMEITLAGVSSGLSASNFHA